MSSEAAREIFMRFKTAVLALSLLVPIPTLSAQPPSQILVGESVRIAHHCDGERAGVTYVGCRRTSGTFVSLANDSLVLRVSDTGDRLAVPLELVNRVEARWGERRHTIEGATYGLLGGATLGLIAGGTCSGWLCGGEFALIAAGIFAAPGLVIGGCIGALVKSDVWGEIPAERLRGSSMPVQPGSLARVTAPACGLRKQVTSVETVFGDTLVLASARTGFGSSFKCPIALIKQFEVRAGRRTQQTMRMAGVGLLVGAAAGVPLGYAVAGENDCADLAKWVCPMLGAGILGVSGAVIGALVGSQVQSDNWKEIPLDRFSLSVVPQQEGVAIRFSFAF